MGVVEAESADAPEPADWLAVVGRVECFAAILYQYEVAAFADVDDRVHGAGIAVDRNDNDAACLRADCCFDLIRIDVECARVDVNDHWYQAALDQRPHGR